MENKYKVEEIKSYIKPLSSIDLNIFNKTIQNYNSKFPTLSNINITQQNSTADQEPENLDLSSTISSLKIPYSEDSELCSNMRGKCAKYVSNIINKLGYDLHFDAWTADKAVNDIGGKKIYGISTDLPSGIANDDVQLARARNIIETSLANNPFDLKSLKEGHIVNLYNPTSSYEAQALNNGNGITHVGIVVRNPKTNALEIEHNWGGSIKHLTLDDIPESKLQIAGVYELPEKNTESMKNGGQFAELNQLNGDVDNVDRILQNSINQRDWMDFVINNIDNSDDSVLKNELKYGSISGNQKYNEKRKRYNLALKIKENYHNPDAIKNNFLRNAIYNRYYKDFASKYERGGSIFKRDGKYHVVKEGEVLGSIANKYGLTVDEISESNDLLDPDKIRVGQKIFIDNTDSPNPLGRIAESFYNDVMSMVNVGKDGKAETATPSMMVEEKVKTSGIPVGDLFDGNYTFDKNYKPGNDLIMHLISQEAPNLGVDASKFTTPEQYYDVIKKRDWKLFIGSDGHVTTALGTKFPDNDHMEGKTISGKKVVDLFKKSLKTALHDVSYKFKGFEYLPVEQKNALVALGFNMGADKIGNLWVNGKNTGKINKFRTHVEHLAKKYKNNEPILKSDIANVLKENDFNGSEVSNNKISWLAMRSVATSLMFANDYDYRYGYDNRFKLGKKDIRDYKISELTKLYNYTNDNVFFSKFGLDNLDIELK